MNRNPPNNRLHGGGTFVNRECRNCTPPCQGGEVLHRRGHCCHSYCLCMGFEPKHGKPLTEALNGRLADSKKRTPVTTWK